MAPKFVLVALVSVLVLFVGAIPTKVSAVTEVTPPNPTNYTSIIIVGEIFCKSCKLPGYVDYLDASPVNGVLVRVSCFGVKSWIYISKYINSIPGGFFYFTWDDVANFDPNLCRIYVDWSPLSYCSRPTYRDGPYAGAELYLVSEKNVTGGTEATYSPGIIYLGPWWWNDVCPNP
ncbi:Pistil-specific extensin-like protein [Rhynchospora pubera]|uniref:Pistil-specific extensin-like protein n=1 Tax=Rhynchospora pubera TaxID=906938 RepID=A0AAV8GTD0_9POAL|nr:Pistil-specific extensin-like protein [Rhynchospora pubera]